MAHKKFPFGKKKNKKCKGPRKVFLKKNTPLTKKLEGLKILGGKYKNLKGVFFISYIKNFWNAEKKIKKPPIAPPPKKKKKKN